jgi:hypothetical protein
MDGAGANAQRERAGDSEPGKPARRGASNHVPALLKQPTANTRTPWHGAYSTFPEFARWRPLRMSSGRNPAHRQLPIPCTIQDSAHGGNKSRTSACFL